MSGNDEDVPVSAFTDLRKRFEQLSASSNSGAAGPSRPSILSKPRIGSRISSDRLHDRLAPPSLQTRSARRSSPVPPVPPPRSRANSNPHLGELETTPLLTTLITTPSPTSAANDLPTLQPRNTSFQDSRNVETLPKFRKAPPPPPPRPSSSAGMRHSVSTGMLVDDTVPITSEASPKPNFTFLPVTSPAIPPYKARKPLVDFTPLIDIEVSASLDETNGADLLQSAVPTWAVQAPSSRKASNAPPIPPRPTFSADSVTPPHSSPSSLNMSPQPSLRSSSPPPLPSRSNRSSLTGDLLTPGSSLPFPSENRSVLQQTPRGGSAPLLSGQTSSTELSHGIPPVSPQYITRKPSSENSVQYPPPIPPRPNMPAAKTEPIIGTDTSLPTTTFMIPPPLPQRHRPSLSGGTEPPPPSLPPRAHSTTATETRPPPALPIRTIAPAIANANGILPPPTRTVGSRDPLPQPRRPSGPGSGDDSSDSGEEQDAESPSAPYHASSISRKRLDELPDSSRSSRRLPAFQPNFNLPTSAHVRIVAVAGNCVCVGGHSIKVYDLDSVDSPLHVFDVKDVGIELRTKETHRTTAMAFRPTESKAEEGRYLWCGLKDGHLFEFDAWNGTVSDIRQNVHAGTVTHIMRYGQRMVTICDAGKSFIYSPPEDSNGTIIGPIHLSRASSGLRHIRVSERQGFARIFGNQLWTANGPGNNNAGGATVARGPTIRVYDLRPGPPSPRTVIPSEAVGQVTCGTVLPSRSENVYIGHEGGSVTIWRRSDDESNEVDATIQHIGTIKLGTSDVLALEGVHARLWAGFRTGNILVYDVETLPWTVTNTWKAHEEYPVLQIEVDPYSVEKCARLTVYSIGRDEKVRFWDGLLGVDHIESELLKREASFSTFRDIKVLIGSWNIDAAKPDMLSSNADSVSFLADHLKSLGEGVECPDIIVFGFQEVIDLESRKLTAKTVLLGGGKRTGHLSDRVSRHYRLWLDQLTLSIRTAMPFDCPYSVVHTENMVGLLTCVFVKNSERNHIKHSSIVTVKRGMKGRYGNKGAIAARFTVDDSSMCFINCHLAAGQKHIRQRNQDIAVILEEKSVFPPAEGSILSYVGGGDGSMVLDHEICFLSGDLNYRIDQRRDVVVSSIQSGDLNSLLQHDQLIREMKINPSFRLRSFTEAPITFVPTYKYDRKSHEFDTSEKRRIPAWCDRILYRSREPDRIQILHYRRYEANISDHRPISGGFRVTVKSIQQEERELEKDKVEANWRERETELLREAHQFYTRELKI